MNVMKRAWEIARNGVKKFGGKVKEYFSIALKLAWKELKNMNKIEVKPGEIAVYGKIRKETEKAILFINQWVPKSQISHIDRENSVVIMQEWVVTKNGWLRTVQVTAQRLANKIEGAKDIDWNEVIAVYAHELKNL